MANFNFLKILSVVVSIVLLSGCATTQHNNEQDPWEGYNRAMYKFNDSVDKAVLKPVAKGYDFIVPEPISWGISNFFSNLNDITVAVNSLLQGKFKQAGHDTGRFLLNSTVGVFGIFDVASHAGRQKNNEDFGQTLGAWGFDSGPYVVLPFMGPRTIRDTFGLVGDIYTDPVTYVSGDDARIAISALRLIDLRASLLGSSSVLETATDDEYAYIRDAYLQRRQFLVHDGNPPNQDNFDEDFDLFDDLE